jgi:hypothetical protein
LLSTTTATLRLRRSPMTDIFARFQGFHPQLTPTTVRQFRRMVSAMLMMTGRVTMLGSSGWAGKGGSYRTVQRVFAQALPWALLLWVCCRQPVYRPGDVYLLAGDEVVVTTAGKHTDGLDRGVASLYSQGGPGWPSSPSRWSTSRNDVLAPSVLSRACAALRRTRPARRMRQRSRRPPPPPDVALGGRGVVRLKPRLPR